MAPSKNKKAKAAAAANKKEDKKPSADAPPTEAFHAAMAEYYAQRDWFNEYKTQFWASIPETPPNESPKIPLEKPWWDKEHDAKWEKQFPGLLEQRRKKDGGMEEGFTDAFQRQMKLQEEKEEEEKAEKKRVREEKQKEREAAAAAGKGKKKEVKGEEFADDDFEIVDVDGLIRRLTGQWELNVPQAFKFPK